MKYAIILKRRNKIPIKVQGGLTRGRACALAARLNDVCTDYKSYFTFVQEWQHDNRTSA